MPTEKQIEQAICCPKGCMRPDDCWAPTMTSVKQGAAKAVMELYKPRVVQRRPFVIEE